ncbi:ABC transporter permease [Paenibacillus piri]|uniref:ABC transporter permease n=1 Tax=Paenibacillus piri TaxID=2547395 RepID=A0A4V2ZUB7_9BACL|nr:ABC transporter permease [Paenibacillus piri]TDG00375.1 ABC transporter permease [Paenibacillus piri]
MDLQALFRSRSALFLKEIRPYLHYALQSAALAAGVAILLFSFAYRQFMLWVTPEFPWALLSAAVMLPALAGGKIRTYLQEADTLFLLPQEQGMTLYLRLSLNRALIVQTAVVTVVWLLLWPLYHKMTGANGWLFPLFLIIWILFKRIMLLGKWTELQMQEKRSRRWYAILRWALCVLSAYALFAMRPAAGILLLSLAAVAYLLLLRLPNRYVVNWSLLIELELAHKAGIYRILNWFIDVPAVQGKARNFRWLDGLTRSVAFRQSHAYTYLYTLVWLRSELFGIIARLTIVGMLLLSSIRHDLALASVYSALAVIGALQLADLKRYYQGHLWQYIYPIREQSVRRSVGAVRFRIHLAILVLLALPAFWTFSNPFYAAGLVMLCATGSGWYHRFR